MAFRDSESPLWAADLLDALLAALSARPAAALLTTPKVLLFVNDFNPTYFSVIGDFTEATFSGYAAGGIALPALAGPLLLTGGARALVGTVNFVADGSLVAPGELVYGYYIAGSAGADLYAFERFIDPVPISQPGDFIHLDVLFPEAAERSTGL